jgi:GxxExxY protein
MTPTGTDSSRDVTQTCRPKGKHDDLTRLVIGVFYDVYNELGGGFLEVVYRESMRIALTDAGLEVGVETPIPVHFRGKLVGSFRADLTVNHLVLLELKACDTLIREHGIQTMNYLKATTFEVALLMNFGSTPKFKRFVMDNDSKRNRCESVQSASSASGRSPVSESSF